MATTPEQRKAFGERLTELRARWNYSQGALAAALAEHGGYAVSGSLISEWERGVSAPKYPNAKALERVLDAPGELAHLLGYRGEEETLTERILALEAAMSQAVAMNEGIVMTQQELLDSVARILATLDRLEGER